MRSVTSHNDDSSDEHREGGGETKRSEVGEGADVGRDVHDELRAKERNQYDES